MLNIESNKLNTIAFTGKETASSFLNYYLLRLVNILTNTEYLIALNKNSDLSANIDRLNIFHYQCPSSNKLGQYDYYIYEGVGQIPNPLSKSGLTLLETGKGFITGAEIITPVENIISFTNKEYDGQGSL